MLKKEYIIEGLNLKNLKTFKPEELINIKDLEAFTLSHGIDTDKLFKLEGETLTDEEIDTALKMLTK